MTAKEERSYKNYNPYLIRSITTTRLHDINSDKDYGGLLQRRKIKDLSAAERVLSCFEMLTCVCSTFSKIRALFCNFFFFPRSVRNDLMPFHIFFFLLGSSSTPFFLLFFLFIKALSQVLTGSQYIQFRTYCPY